MKIKKEIPFFKRGKKKLVQELEKKGSNFHFKLRIMGERLSPLCQNQNPIRRLIKPLDHFQPFKNPPSGKTPMRLWKSILQRGSIVAARHFLGENASFWGRKGAQLIISRRPIRVKTFFEPMWKHSWSQCEIIIADKLLFDRNRRYCIIQRTRIIFINNYGGKKRSWKFICYATRGII